METIGMLIWKEMKSQGISRSELSEMLKTYGIKIGNLAQQETIAAIALLQISVVLNRNFFEYYKPEDLAKIVDTDPQRTLRNKIEILHEVIEEKTKLLRAQKQYIKTQERVIEALEKQLSDSNNS
jgi:hypothetical protein